MTNNGQATHSQGEVFEIDSVPDGWHVVTFSEIREWLQYGTSIHCTAEPHGFPVLRIPNIESGRVNAADLKYCDLSDDEAQKYLLEKGDLLFVRTNGVLERLGSCAVYSGEPQQALFASYLIRARLSRGVDPRYVAYFYGSQVGTSLIAGRATPAADGKFNLNTGIIDSLPLPLPPTLDEQRSIVAVLAWVRQAMHMHEKSTTIVHELKQRVMSEVFARGLRGEAQKETEIGLMPQSWEPRSIIELCEVWSGGTPRKSIAEYWNGDIPWVSGKDLKAPALDDAIDHVSDSGVQAGSRLAPAGAVLLLVRGMGLAKDLPVAVINRRMAFNQDVKALVSRGQYSGQFLRSAIYAGKERLLSQIVPSAHGTLTLNLNDVETFKVACPSDPEEAKDIVAILDALDRKIDLHRRKRAVVEELFKSLLHNLMTGEISISDLELAALSSASTKHEEVAA
ncbi:restriction endonuclease subunit S [Burkholderia ubonensis]|uniref:restriction endonuclease subunit S n=1 Tax=Burkholderia ubonensis TaxID=101571 RepID=UPI0009B56C33|nr:restriction endonuclease subunit S [Burkholderia ubonensis]